MNWWVNVAISALSDFFITAGTAYLAIASASGTSAPTQTQVITCVVGGVVQAARGVQKTLAPPPQ